jgi:hypothetical protein
MGSEDAAAGNGSDRVDTLEHAQLVEPTQGTKMKEGGPKATAREAKGQLVVCLNPSAL